MESSQVSRQSLLVAAGMLVTGGMHIHGIALQGTDLISSPLLWLVAMLLVGVTEEYFFRGYALQLLWRGTGFWPAALITTALFAGLHLVKPHENAIDIGMIWRSASSSASAFVSQDRFGGQSAGMPLLILASSS